MLIVHVHIKIKSDCIDAFKEATTKNASASIKEIGIARFDIIQSAEDPTRFVLIEAYRSKDAAALHKATPHYAEWRDRMESLMAEPRYSVKYSNVFPAD